MALATLGAPSVKKMESLQKQQEVLRIRDESVRKNGGLVQRKASRFCFCFL